MKVAVIGTGPAGLACGVELQRLGIKPVIYERNHRVGFSSGRADLMLQMIYRPVRDQVRYLHRYCGLNLVPLSAIKKIMLNLYGHKTRVAGGKLGYIFYRSQDVNSVENQLHAMLQGPVIFDSHRKLKDLAPYYDAVVVAQGNSAAARELNCWREFTKVVAKGAIVLGNFNPAQVNLYFDNRYARHAYGYLAPINNKRASLCFCVPGIKNEDMDSHWNYFLSRERELNQLYCVSTYDMEWHCGSVTRRHIDNIYLVGASGGFTEKLMGTGFFSSIISGVLAARCIAYGWNYEHLAGPMLAHLERLALIRDALDGPDSRAVHALLKALELPGLKQLLYNTNFNVIKKCEKMLRNSDMLRDKYHGTHPRRAGEPN